MSATKPAPVAAGKGLVEEPVAQEGIAGTTFVSRRFHFVGVGGAGMSGLARLLSGAGGVVSGSDCAGGSIVERDRKSVV